MLANVLEKKKENGFTQFELTTNLLNNLSQFNLTPTAKLVLLELSTHYNQEKNGAVVYPAIETIAETLGIGLTSAKQAIKDLISEGLIIKSKRSNVSGNYNKYVLTLKVQNSTYKESENELSKQSKSDLFYIRTNNFEQRKEQGVNKNNLGGNVYLTSEQSADDEILRDYAEKHAKKSVEGYIKRLKETGAAKSIIKEAKKKAFINKRASENILETKKLLETYKEWEQNASSPDNCKAWQELKKKWNIAPL